MTLSDYIGAIGIISTIVSIVVGIIGAKALNTANKIKANTICSSTVAQGENVTIINNGNDAYALMKIAKDVTQSELIGIVQQLASLKETVDKFPNISYGEKLPERLNEGDIFFLISKEETTDGQD